MYGLSAGTKKSGCWRGVIVWGGSTVVDEIDIARITRKKENFKKFLFFFSDTLNVYFIFCELWKHLFVFHETRSKPFPLYHPRLVSACSACASFRWVTRIVIWQFSHWRGAMPERFVINDTFLHLPVLYYLFSFEFWYLFSPAWVQL